METVDLWTYEIKCLKMVLDLWMFRDWHNKTQVFVNLGPHSAFLNMVELFLGKNNLRKAADFQLVTV